MKRFIWPGLALVVAVSTAICSLYLERNQSQEAFRPGNLIRLHVVANSDREEDQQLKLTVRDAILRDLQPRLTEFGRADLAFDFLACNQDLVKAAIDAQLKRLNVSQSYRVEVGTFDFPERAYGDLIVPRGRYRALRVVLGEGLGKNWWCVLFPPLCFKDLTTKTGVERPEASRPQAAVQSKIKEPSRVSLLDEDSMTEVRVRYKIAFAEWIKASRDRILAAMARR